MQIMFYSEKNGFYKYFQNIIEYLLENTDVVINYVTSDPEDRVFQMASDRFRPLHRRAQVNRPYDEGGSGYCSDDNARFGKLPY